MFFFFFLLSLYKFLVNFSFCINFFCVDLDALLCLQLSTSKMLFTLFVTIFSCLRQRRGIRPLMMLRRNLLDGTVGSALSFDLRILDYIFIAFCLLLIFVFTYQEDSSVSGILIGLLTANPFFVSLIISIVCMQSSNWLRYSTLSIAL
jgi:hypothetical protein